MAGIANAMAMKALLEKGITSGTVMLFGTPSEGINIDYLFVYPFLVSNIYFEMIKTLITPMDNNDNNNILPI